VFGDTPVRWESLGQTGRGFNPGIGGNMRLAGRSRELCGPARENTDDERTLRVPARRLAIHAFDSSPAGRLHVTLSARLDGGSATDGTSGTTAGAPCNRGKSTIAHCVSWRVSQFGTEGSGRRSGEWSRVQPALSVAASGSIRFSGVQRRMGPPGGCPGPATASWRREQKTDNRPHWSRRLFFPVGS
jgi:hypothetical protein